MLRAIRRGYLTNNITGNTTTRHRKSLAHVLRPDRQYTGLLARQYSNFKNNEGHLKGGGGGSVRATPLHLNFSEQSEQSEDDLEMESESSSTTQENPPDKKQEEKDEQGKKIENEYAQFVLSPLQKAKGIVFSRTSAQFSSATLEEIHSSTLPFVIGDDLKIALAIRTNDKHFHNITEVPKSTLTFFPLSPSHIAMDNLPLPKVHFSGSTNPLSETNRQQSLQHFITVHPASKSHLQSSRFTLFEFDVEAAYYMECTGEITTLDVPGLRAGSMDPIQPAIRRIMEVANLEWGKEIVELCEENSGTSIEEAFVYGVDRFGYDVLGKEKETGNWLAFRFLLDSTVTDPETYQQHLENSIKRI